MKCRNQVIALTASVCLLVLMMPATGLATEKESVSSALISEEGDQNALVSEEEDSGTSILEEDGIMALSGIEDITAPTLTELSLSRNQVEAPSTVEVTADGRDDVSGVSDISVEFYNATIKKAGNTK